MKRQISEKRDGRRLLLPILLATICGCGSAARVTGKVTYQGRPVKYGSVIFLSADKTARFGVIEPDGSYTVESVPSGTVTIAVISRDPQEGPFRRARRDGKQAPGKRRPRDGSPCRRCWKIRKCPGRAASSVPARVSHDIDLK